MNSNDFAATLSSQLDDLLEVEDGLSDREVDFLEDMAKIRQGYRTSPGADVDAVEADELWYAQLSPAQQDWLRSIHERKC